MNFPVDYTQPVNESTLILSSHAPDPEGNGPRRRIFATLNALAEQGAVDLLLLGAINTPAASALPPSLPGHAVHQPPYPELRGTTRWKAGMGRRWPALFATLFGRPGDWPHTPLLIRQALAWAGARRWGRIHAYRLNMAPIALALADATGGRPRLHLDLDDLEAHTHERIGELARRNGDRPTARHYTVAARVLRRIERRLLPRFERVYVCSRLDAEKLALPSARVLPNVAPAKETVRPEVRSTGLRALFLGTLSYYPNEDALRVIRVELLPLLRAQGVEIAVAGLLAGPRIAPLLVATEGFRYLGHVPTAAEAFAQADCLIVPLRAGGGTRLKILESFAYGCPVVSTALGIEGIEARPEVHYLPAETPTEFAGQLRRLAQEPGLGEKLSRNARALVERDYSPAAVAAALAP